MYKQVIIVISIIVKLELVGDKEVFKDNLSKLLVECSKNNKEGSVLPTVSLVSL